MTAKNKWWNEQKQQESELKTAAAIVPSTTVPTKTTTSYPDAVQARRITAISAAAADGSKKLTLADKTEVVVNLATLAGYSPSVGDYYVVPAEGNPYCVAKSTFAVTYTTAF